MDATIVYRCTKAISQKLNIIEDCSLAYFKMLHQRFHGGMSAIINECIDVENTFELGRQLSTIPSDASQYPYPHVMNDEEPSSITT